MKLIFALSIAFAALHGATASANAPDSSTPAPELKDETGSAKESTLFTRVNGAYRKTEKQLKRES
ncbi:MAG: hypothetical protein EOP11_21030 [Proteobacteria bacterium]|nr:MAG: hypothetical protein EOP11_21030 [Pseudomonadota bacterium]